MVYSTLLGENENVKSSHLSIFTSLKHFNDAFDVHFLGLILHYMFIYMFTLYVYLYVYTMSQTTDSM